MDSNGSENDGEWSDADASLPKMAVTASSIVSLVRGVCETFGVPSNELVSKIEREAAKSKDRRAIINFAARQAAALSVDDVAYDAVSREVFLAQVVEEACDTLERAADETCETVDPAYVQFVRTHAQKLARAMDHSRDSRLDAPGLTVLMRSYLWKRADGTVVETPQMMFMRVAIEVSGCCQMPPRQSENEDRSISGVIENYEHMSLGRFTHASPTMFNAGLVQKQMSSCFVLFPDTGVRGVLKCQYQAGLISTHAGGIGMAIHGQHFHGRVVPVLQAYEKTMHIAEQSGGKRNGRMCVYIEPCSAFITEILSLHRNDGNESERCHDTYTAIWIPDEFMRRVEADEEWTMFSDESLLVELSKLHGDAFVARYTEAESSRNISKMHVRARALMMDICKAQCETGRPFVCFKDHANAKSNHSHLGTIKSSNLCTEIYQYTDENHTAVCNLASLVLPAYFKKVKVGDADGSFELDRELLQRAVRRLVRNLNVVIDSNYYPTTESHASNMRTRPVGIGLQGFQDVLFQLGLPFDSPEARILNREVFEIIYYTAVRESAEMARTDGVCEAHAGSPASEGRLSPDLWGVNAVDFVSRGYLDWDDLRAYVREHGMRNTLLVALMPTATTSIIMGSCAESIEPVYSHIYTRRLLSGETICVNRHLQSHLKKLGLWSSEMLAKIIAHNGLIGGIEEIPADVRHLFRTVWEISLRQQLMLTADRAPFIDQGQSTNVFMRQPDVRKLMTYHMLAWNLGVKTSMYYLRQQPEQRATQFAVCSRANGTGACDACSA